MTKKTSQKKPADPQLAELRIQLAKAQDQAKEYLAGWKRAQADYDNLQKRTQEQRAHLLAATMQEVVRGLLPVMDNLDLVIKHTDANTTDIQAGARMVAKQLHEVLAAQGLSAIEAVGQPFDPSVHEAIASVPGNKNMCVAEHARGYKVGELVLRPSRVSVGNGAPAKVQRPLDTARKGDTKS